MCRVDERRGAVDRSFVAACGICSAISTGKTRGAEWHPRAKVREHLSESRVQAEGERVGRGEKEYRDGGGARGQLHLSRRVGAHLPQNPSSFACGYDGR
jgi:hypothetical protein